MFVSLSDMFDVDMLRRMIVLGVISLKCEMSLVNRRMPVMMSVMVMTIGISMVSLMVTRFVLLCIDLSTWYLVVGLY